MKENQESNKNKNEDLTAAMPSFLQEVEEEAEEVSLPSCPAWMVTFGDAISLLLTFFVLILSFSNISTDVMTDFLTFLTGMGSEIRIVGGQEGALISLGDLLVKQTDDKSTEEHDFKDFMEKIEAEELMLEDEGNYGLNASMEELKRYFLSEGLQDSIEIEADDELGSFRVLFDHNFVFSIGLSQFLAENKKHVDRVAELISELPNDITIVGHSNDYNEVAFAEYSSPYELGIARASNLSKYLISVWGIAPERIGVQIELAEEDDIVTQINEDSSRVQLTINILSEFNGFYRSELKKKMKTKGQNSQNG